MTPGVLCTKDTAMSTKERLAAALTKLGLADMAKRAGTGHYDDFESDSPSPIRMLVQDLEAAAAGNPREREILALAEKAKHGEFDATKEEANAWAEKEKIWG